MNNAPLTLPAAAAAIGCSVRTMQRLLLALPAARAAAGGGRGHLSTVLPAALPALRQALAARRLRRASAAAAGRVAAGAARRAASAATVTPVPAALADML